MNITPTPATTVWPSKVRVRGQDITPNGVCGLFVAGIVIFRHLQYYCSIAVRVDERPSRLTPIPNKGSFCSDERIRMVRGNY